MLLITAVPHLNGLPAGRQLQQGAAIRGNHQAAAVEHQFVVAAHLVEVHHRAVQTSGRLAGQLAPQGRFAGVKRRGRQIDQQIGFCLHQGGDRVRSRQPLPLQRILHPEVFADGEPQPLTSRQGQQAGAVAGAEIAPLIKHVVTGQQLFAGHPPPTPLVHQGDAVVQARGAIVVAGEGHPHQQGAQSIELLDQPIEHRALQGQPRRLQQQVPGGIAPEGELRRQQQRCSFGAGATGGRQDSFGVAPQVAHHRIQLGQGQAHQRRLGDSPYRLCSNSRVHTAAGIWRCSGD